HHRVLLVGLVGGGIKQPALYAESVARPVQALSLAPWRFAGAVFVRHLRPVADAAAPDLGRRAEGMADDDAGFAVGGHGNPVVVEGWVDALIALPQAFDLAGGGIHLRDGAAAIVVLGEEEPVAVFRPEEADGGRGHARSEVARAAGPGGRPGRDLEDVAAGGTFVAHQAADKHDGFSVGGPARPCDLL